MNKKTFCQTCGQDIKLSEKVCTNCGTAIKVQQPQQIKKKNKQQLKPKKVKKPLAKQRKLVFSVALSLATLFVGFAIWANIYYSKDSTEKRFYKAVENEEITQLENVLIHENGTTVTKGEIEAFLKLASNDEIEDLVSIQPDDKFMGIFQTYKMVPVSQFTYYSGIVDGLDITLNGSEIIGKKEQEGFTYGPLLPGIYTVNVSLNNDFGKSDTNFELKLAHQNSEKVLMDKLPIGEATVHIANFDSELMVNSSILVNDKKVAVDESGKSTVIGPIFLDGSQEVKVETKYPWGEVQSKLYPLNSETIEVNAAIVSENELNKMKETLLTFGEEMQRAKAEFSTDALTTATDILKEDFQNYEIEPLVKNNILYNGKLNKIDINTDSVWHNNGLLMMGSIIDYSHSLHKSTEQPPALEQNELHSFIGFAFDDTTDEWKVSYIEATNDEGIKPTETLAGSGIVYKPHEEVVSNQEDPGIDVQLQDFIEEYTVASVDAINHHDISYMSPYLTTDGPRYKEAKDYIAYLKSKGITEKLISTNVTNIMETSNNTYQVTFVEEFIIYYPKSEAQKKYETVVEVRNVNGSWKVHKLLSTKEI